MTDELRIHWELHGIDEQAVAAAAARAKLAPERQALAARVTSARSALTALEKAEAGAREDRRRLEQEAEALLVSERRFQKQLEAVTDQKQYDAVQHEIAAVHAKRSDLETDALMRLEAEEQAAAGRPGAAVALALAEQAAAAGTAALAEREAALDAELAALAARRETATAGLPPADRARYERLRSGRTGRAVAAIEHDACGACHRGLTPAALQAARRRDQLLTCDGCGSLMLLPPGDA